MSSVSKKQAASNSVSLIGSMFQSGLYKPQQGRIVRQVTFLSIAVVALLVGADVSRMSYFDELFTGSSYAVFGLVAAVGVWFAYRIVNYPVFTDFLIAVEAEMKKVSWPAWPQLWAASQVVIFVIFSMAISLWVFDILWTKIFQIIGIR
ncbi:MAG: preprotein translocase subunit SecE [Planctomycetaceae bacterium]|nr:preprotein translocase subunit SecE [Planctomycetaceae bacterium]MCP4462668.1 preprotein translocase subunit SecE [Planctomycetaceae bacterium]MDG1808561.1 preprotein translocase subunit SecE [Pirellulaceae bacterium]MDG2105883.1 preprotein translocase subunit SecE [Pirellulaceae bacterium]